MSVYESLWRYIILCDCIWRFMGVCEPFVGIWNFMIVYECKW